MKNSPDDEQKLTAFLRQNAPSPPEADPDLAEHIFQHIQQDVPKKRNYYLWLIPSTIITTMIMGLTGYNLWLNHETAKIENQKLEAFLDQNWDSLSDLHDQHNQRFLDE